jgi:hypothetical protein
MATQQKKISFNVTDEQQATLEEACENIRERGIDVKVESLVKFIILSKTPDDLENEYYKSLSALLKKKRPSKKATQVEDPTA